MAQLLEKLFKPFTVIINFIKGLIQSVVMFYETAIKVTPIIQTMWLWIPQVFQGLLVMAVSLIIIKIIKDII